MLIPKKVYFPYLPVLFAVIYSAVSTLCDTAYVIPAPTPTGFHFSTSRLLDSKFFQNRNLEFDLSKGFQTQ